MPNRRPHSTNTLPTPKAGPVPIDLASLQRCKMTRLLSSGRASCSNDDRKQYNHDCQSPRPASTQLLHHHHRLFSFLFPAWRSRKANGAASHCKRKTSATRESEVGPRLGPPCSSPSRPCYQHRCCYDFLFAFLFVLLLLPLAVVTHLQKWSDGAIALSLFW